MAWAHCEPGSFPRYATDIVAYRYMALRRPRRYDAPRTIRLRNGVVVEYRLNRGDILTVREVWFQEAYRLPFDLPGTGGTLVDLGGNIGLTSIYLARRHGFERVVMVEPDVANAELARRNCRRNGIEARIVEAAIGPRPGKAAFAVHGDHNQGRVDSQGRGNGAELSTEVQVTTMDEVTGAGEPVRLVKLDIEGGEQDLLTDRVDWLDRVTAMVAEFHPGLVDYPGLLEVLRRRGFEYFPCGTGHRFGSDAFLRPGG